MYAPSKKLVGMEKDQIPMESDPHITFLLYFNSNLNFKYEYKTDVSDSDFYSDIYSIVFKVDIVKVIIYE